MHSNKPKPLPTLSQADVERFWSKVIKGEPNECWPWLGGCAKGGSYASFWVKSFQLIASRVSYFLATGNDPAPLLVRHTCDNPWCVNPGHLIPGTHQDNNNDCVQRGRRPRGSNCATSKLTESRVAALLVDRAAGMSIPMLGRKYAITQGAVIPIIKGLTWKHVPGPREAQKKHLSAETRAEIRRKRAEGMTLADLARAYGMSVGAVGMLTKRQTWASDPE